MEVEFDDDDDFEIFPPSMQTSIVKFHSGPGKSSGLARNKIRKHALKAKQIKMMDV